MTATQQQLDEALELFLSADPGAFVSALDEGGFRAEPHPGFDVFTRFTPVPTLGVRRTMLEAVITPDRRVILDVWFRAKKEKIAFGTVHLTTDAERPMSLMVVSMHHRGYGWLAVVADQGKDSRHKNFPTQAQAFVDVLKPRTATVTKNIYGMYLEVDERICQMTDWKPEDLIAKTSLELMHPDDHDRAISSWMNLLSDGIDVRNRFRQLCADGSWLWLEADNELQAHADPDLVRVITHLTDVSDEMSAYEALERQERQLRRLAESLPSGLIQVNPDGNVDYANGRAREILGVAHTDSLDGWLVLLTEQDRSQVLKELSSVLGDRRSRKLEVSLRLGEKDAAWCIISITALAEDGDDSAGATISLLDITEIVRLRQALTVQATIDPLTGCNNRASTLEILDRALATQSAWTTAVVFIDLDKFKPVNDQLGHAAGDEFLLEAARRLRSAVRSNDIVGRIGGDEFLIICQHLTTDDEVIALTLRIKAILESDVMIASTRVSMRASIGVAVTEAGIGAEELVGLADAAMYESKRGNTGTPVRFHRGQMYQLTA